jgi:hypothetical protein
MRAALSILHLSDAEQAEAVDRFRTFTTMTQAGAKTWPAQQAVLLVDLGVDDELDDEPAISAIGVVTRSHNRVATGWHRLRYVQRLQIEPLGLDELLEAVPLRVRSHVRARLESGGVLPDRSAHEILAAISKLRPEAGRELRSLLGEAQRKPRTLRGEALQAAAHEADAVRLALDIAEIPRRELQAIRPDGKVPFLQRLEKLAVAEDPAAAYDSMRFLDFERLEHPSGVVQFTNRDERLTVMNVNRQPLERTTGADLIYLNETIGAFVFVQYKTMRSLSRNGDRVGYRPDKQLRDELKRMRKIRVGPDDGALDSYRFDAACAFLKLCKPVEALDFSPRELVGGMYLPLDYYDRLVDSKEAKGPRGGVVLSYETVRRRIRNDLFIRLVRDAWVGTRGVTTERLMEAVLAGLAADRSVTIAAASRTA